MVNSKVNAAGNFCVCTAAAPEWCSNNSCGLIGQCGGKGFRDSRFSLHGILIIFTAGKIFALSDFHTIDSDDVATVHIEDFCQML